MTEVDQQRGGRVDPVRLMINRSDYMLDQPSNGILQVEINMIAASFGCLSALVTRMHQYTLEKSGVLEAGRVAENKSLEGLAAGIAAAHRALAPPAGAQVLMVVQPDERNAYDQQWLATELYNK